MTCAYVKLSGQRNQCPSCCELFATNAAFERHRVGRIGVDRRCMTLEELTQAGAYRDAKGFWRLPRPRVDPHWLQRLKRQDRQAENAIPEET